MSALAERLTSVIKDLEKIVQELSTSSQPTLKKVPKLLYAAPRDSFWYADISNLPVHPNSKQYCANIGNSGIHPDFGGGEDGKLYGIPITVVDNRTPKHKIDFTCKEESDNVNYPLGQVEPWTDRHSIVVNTEENKLYEIYDTDALNLTGYSGAVFDLSSNAMRTYSHTSADAAGLPIALGLVRYDEIEAGEINHAIRFTAEKTYGSVLPASHCTSGQNGLLNPYQPPLGAWFRLRKDFDITPFPREVQIIMTAMKVHGLILADNGSNWFISGCPDSRWNSDNLSLLGKIRRDDMEMVDASGIWKEQGSYAVTI